jgi:hypothetical protein
MVKKSVEIVLKISLKNVTKLKNQSSKVTKKISIFFFEIWLNFQKKKEYCDFMHDRQFDYYHKILKKEP